MVRLRQTSRIVFALPGLRSLRSAITRSKSTSAHEGMPEIIRTSSSTQRSAIFWIFVGQWLSSAIAGPGRYIVEIGQRISGVTMPERSPVRMP